MDKRYAHHVLVRLRVIRSWYFVILIVASAGVSVMALRHNSLQAVALRDRVMVADEQNQGTEAALRELREYVYAHMNTSLYTPGGAYPPIQLKHHYDRLVAVEKARASAANASLATDAQRHCETLIPTGRLRGRVQCIKDFMTSRGAVEQPIPDALYKFDFVPPRWSWDVAGISLATTCIVSILFIIRVIAVRIIKQRLS